MLPYIAEVSSTLFNVNVNLALEVLLSLMLVATKAYYLRQVDYVFSSICLSVCLVSKITHKIMKDFKKIL